MLVSSSSSPAHRPPRGLHHVQPSSSTRNGELPSSSTKPLAWSSSSSGPVGTATNTLLDPHASTVGIQSHVPTGSSINNHQLIRNRGTPPEDGGPVGASALNHLPRSGLVVNKIANRNSRSCLVRARGPQTTSSPWCPGHHLSMTVLVRGLPLTICAKEKRREEMVCKYQLTD